ncbi:GTP cyclohydrolase I FolE [Thermoflexus sp.]|uniref:GTP cyclohydrolase I FolE n=1 Tax=Thermoflexus sp. TaxID=1969742 RepID=UPI002ADE77A1|nr:GTP cyclohydrolase I FolE [Thermoflexus sp.]
MEPQGWIAKAEPIAPPPDPIQLARVIRELLMALGEDPEREGLRRTPARVAEMLQEVLAGYWMDPVALINGAIFEVEDNDLVLVRDIEFYSMCEHHLLPFYGRVHVAYIPNGRIIGLSKIPRVVELFARRLQVQERMTRQIADFLEAVLHPQGVAVVVEAAHLCAMMRGVRKSHARMVTQALTGVFRTDPRHRSELLAHLRRPPEKII